MPCFAWNFHSASLLLSNCAKFWPIWRNRRAEADNSPNFRPPLRAALQRWNTPAANRLGFGNSQLGRRGEAGYRVETPVGELGWYTQGAAARGSSLASQETPKETAIKPTNQ